MNLDDLKRELSAMCDTPDCDLGWVIDHLHAKGRIVPDGYVADDLKKLAAKIRQKKGFYAISVGHDEVKQAHKAGILKGLDIVHKELEAMIAAAQKVGE